MKIISIRRNGIFIHYVQATERRYEKMVNENLIHIGDNVYSDLGIFTIWKEFIFYDIMKAVKK